MIYIQGLNIVGRIEHLQYGTTVLLHHSPGHIEAGHSVMAC